MHLVVLDEGCIELHRNAYSNVTWEIIAHLSRGEDVVICGQNSSDALEVEWASDYFSEFVRTKERVKADILVAHPNQLQAYIDAEQRFLAFNGYKVINGTVRPDPAGSKETKEKQKAVLRIIRELCSRIFSYNRFLAGKTLKCVKSRQYEYVEVENVPNWGGKQFFGKLGADYCLYCNFGEVFWGPISRQKNGKEQVAELHTGFDHYFTKCEHPYLGISIYNLIAACDTCNSHLKTQTFFSVEKHAHPYVNDFHSLMCFETNFKKLRDFEALGAKMPLWLNRRGKIPEEILAENLANDMGILSIYRLSAKDEVSHVVRAMDQRLSDFADYKVKRKDKAWYASKNVADFCFNLESSEINRHRFGKLFIDLVEEYELQH